MSVQDSKRRRALKGPSVLTVEEAAKMLRIGRSAAYTAIRRKQIPSLRLGRKIAVPIKALQKLLGETAA